jgi:hypothetical protein
MRRSILIGAGIAGAALGARRLARRGCGGFDFEQMIERMPENAPPKWMFRNISAIRRNTDRILTLLESERGAVAERPPRTAV